MNHLAPKSAMITLGTSVASSSIVAARKVVKKRIVMELKENHKVCEFRALWLALKARNRVIVDYRAAWSDEFARVEAQGQDNRACLCAADMATIDAHYAVWQAIRAVAIEEGASEHAATDYANRTAIAPR